MVGDFHDDELPSDRLPRRDIDVSQLNRRIVTHKWWLILPTLACFLGSAVLVNVVAPRYTGETKILLENQESYFTRGDKVDPQPAPLPDDEAVQSQVQLVTSRDLARSAIRQLDLQGDPEFDPLARGIGPITRTLILLGLDQDPMRVPPEERMLETFSDNLTVFPVTKSRVLTIEFEARNPDLAARASNTVADLYIGLQASAKRDAARQAADTLRNLIGTLRGKAADAEAQAQAFRTQSGLVLGTNNNTITSQQLADMSNQLAQARSTEADAQAKAKLIRDMIKAGRTADIPDVVNGDLIRRLSEQRANAQAEIALQSRTLLPGHPRMQELSAQLVDFDRQLRVAADKAARTLDNDARIAASRVDNLTAAMNTQKDVIGAAGGDQVKLNELDLNARLLKDQLELNTSKYQEAMARENAVSTPADARVISRAVAPQNPSFPKKLPIIAIATIAGALLSLGIVLAREFLSGRAFVPDERADDLPMSIRTGSEGDAAPTPAPLLLGDDRVRAEPARDAVADQPRHDEVAEEPRTIAEPVKVLRNPFDRTVDAILIRKERDRALRLMVCRSDASSPAPLALRIGRVLSRSARAIAIDCFEEGEAGLDIQSLAGFTSQGTPGFEELLSGHASFAEVIHRDIASRLHFVSGLLTHEQRSSDEGGLGNLLDALAETYDFVIASGPALDASAPTLLPEHLDLVIFEAEAGTPASEIARVEALFASPGGGGPEVLAVPGLSTSLAGDTLAGSVAA